MEYREHLRRSPIPEILAIRPSATDNIVVCDAGGLYNRCKEWITEDAHGFVSITKDRLDRLREGDLSLVAASDQFLRKLEDDQFLSRNWGAQADVVGSLANVPSFLAGHPLSMRRRVRLKKPMGPLCLFLETTGSGSTMVGNTVLARGAAMLALARVLSAQRPIELYVCTTYGSRNEMNAVLCRVETTPLDLGRAAFMLGDLLSMSSIGYSLLYRIHDRGPGSWSYGSPDLERRYCGEIFRRFLTPDSEILYVPAAFSRDPSMAQAEIWIRAMLKKYGGDAVVREDDDVVADTGFMEDAL